MSFFKNKFSLGETDVFYGEKEWTQTRLLNHCILLNRVVFFFNRGRKEERKTTVKNLLEDLSVFKWDDNNKLQSRCYRWCMWNDPTVCAVFFYLQGSNKPTVWSCIRYKWSYKKAEGKYCFSWMINFLYLLFISWIHDSLTGFSPCWS